MNTTVNINGHRLLLVIGSNMASRYSHERVGYNGREVCASGWVSEERKMKSRLWIVGRRVPFGIVSCLCLADCCFATSTSHLHTICSNIDITSWVKKWLLCDHRVVTWWSLLVVGWSQGGLRVIAAWFPRSGSQVVTGHKLSFVKDNIWYLVRRLHMFIHDLAGI